MSDDSFSHLRHELRTPLNQIIGYSEMMEEEAVDSGQQGFVSDLQKIQKAARNLLETISTHLSPDSTGKIDSKLQPPAQAKTDKPVPRRDTPPGVGHLLVVDDNEMNRDMLSRKLEREGFSVDVAADGRQALEVIRKTPFDLVLLDIMMPELDGYEVLERMKADPQLRHIPVIMISALDELESVVRCIEIGAEDYLPKPFNPTLLRARIGACLEKKQLRDQEQRTYQALVESQKHLAAELAEAAEYVKSLLPPPLNGEINAESRFIPSTQLGGDAFGYHWLDPEHFAMYLLDVCGHGVGAALLSISVMNVLRSQSLAADFRQPGAVLAALNDAFQMDNQNNMYFTIWYGVFNKTNRILTYSSGGHPPSVLISDHRPPLQLRTEGMVIGSMPGVQFQTAQCPLPPDGRLFIFSDGTYEITKGDGTMFQLEEFTQRLAVTTDLDDLIAFIKEMNKGATFDDDFSIMKLQF